MSALVGCSKSAPPSAFSINSASYAQTFDAAREVLRRYHFELDRVDASAGVITTSPSSSAGFATPWIDHTDMVGGGIESTINDERRIASVLFTESATGSATHDVKVFVRVQRVYRPGRRPDATGVRLGSFATDPRLVESGEQPWYAADVRDDDRLAARIAEDIRSNAAK